MKKVSLGERIRYHFENTLSGGTKAIIGWLAVLSLFIIIVSGVVVTFIGFPVPGGDGKDVMSFGEAAWQSLLRTIDPGTFAGDTGWTFRVVTFIITIGGIFIISTLIGALSTGLQGKIEQMRKGRTRVLEKGHTLILGWSSKVIPIISELLVANENVRNGRIVILAPRDKVEMEDELRDKLPDRGRTKIICRTGNPLDLIDLEIGSPNSSKSIIVLSPEEGNPDISVVKTILALTNNPRRRKEKYHIVAEIHNEQNIEAAELAGGDEITLVHSADLIARLTAQTCRQSGLSVVYTELLDFDGDEIYLQNEPSLSGKSFRDAAFAYESSAIMGIYRGNGEMLINPPAETKIGADDFVIAISRDDDTVVPSGRKDFAVNESAIVNEGRKAAGKERFIVLGWNDKAEVILRELDAYVAKGSEAMVLAELDTLGEIASRLGASLNNLTIKHRIGDATDRATLNEVDVVSYDTVILLGYHDIDIQEADAKTLISLLHLRSISESTKKDLKIVSEMFDIRNRELAEVTKADDFIISDKIISLMLSQLSENGRLKKVFDDLFSPEGSEIYLKPSENYVKSGIETDFYTVLDSTLRRRETAIGYRISKYEHDSNRQYGIVVNPVKTEKIVFSPDDKIIVLAED